MTRPTLRDMAAIAEVIGTFGLIVSLVFVVYSIDKNTAEVNAMHSNSVFDANREVELAVGSDAEWSRIIAERRSQRPLSTSRCRKRDRPTRRIPAPARTTSRDQ